jgi:cytoskeletal protein RodZ
MTKNQKIALGCGAVGCLGLLVLAVAVGAFVFWKYSTQRSETSTAEPENPVASSEPRSEPGNPNYGFNSNSNPSRNRSSESSSSSPSSITASSMSDDKKHRLFQAAGITKDQQLIERVMKKIGLLKPDGTTTDDYPQFIKDHFTWAINNSSFINSVNTPEKGRAYVSEHLED